mmetsp:Transcript_90265/g.179616  ORF Transcript_90265/g.179616 Transcript_90265/m.179616 type:complete len:91 (+) Transcript_90265:184-456(+)|eukprot:CAMPEP_0172695590 /NCGR_PEP_ID=MMETSP1074-20121228/27454_1 /TAXON_ID=2916 /ORGANISM="Ceratium fusus, Strain PA161109" /LENGTH=90 /DNA_ID=CAMNT_0013516229 /DNA_START=74 /DNA_END=346 /DNA_ORIENTATION=-
MADPVQAQQGLLYLASIKTCPRKPGHSDSATPMDTCRKFVQPSTWKERSDQQQPEAEATAAKATAALKRDGQISNNPTCLACHIQRAGKC